MPQLEGDYISAPTEAQGYLVAAEAMLAGVRPLSLVDPLPSIALTLLCGHGTEAALKALLAQRGLGQDALSRSPYGHNLISLWDAAFGSRAGGATPRPEWVDHLNRVYVAPFNLRYPLGFSGIVLPNQHLMVAGLEELVRAAVEAVWP